MINRFFLERFISSFSDGIHISPCGFKESLMDSRIIVVRQTCSISYGFQLVSLLQVDGFRCPIEMINNHVLSKSYLMLDLKIQKGPFCTFSPFVFPDPCPCKCCLVLGARLIWPNSYLGDLLLHSWYFNFFIIMVKGAWH